MFVPYANNSRRLVIRRPSRNAPNPEWAAEKIARLNKTESSSGSSSSHFLVKYPPSSLYIWHRLYQKAAFVWWRSDVNTMQKDADLLSPVPRINSRSGCFEFQAIVHQFWWFYNSYRLLPHSSRIFSLPRRVIILFLTLSTGGTKFHAFTNCLPIGMDLLLRQLIFLKNCCRSDNYVVQFIAECYGCQDLSDCVDKLGISDLNVHHNSHQTVLKMLFWTGL